MSPGASIAIADAASSDPTLSVMLVIALSGMPLVLPCPAYVSSRFAGKVSLEGGYGH